MSSPAIPFDAFTLAAVAAELRAVAVGGIVQKVQQPSAAELIVSVYGHAGAQRVLLSADPQAPRVHLTQVRRENPVTPPNFCQLARKLLEGAVLTDVQMPRFDRVVHLVFRDHDGGQIRLVAELMGRNANLVLVTGSDVVRAAIRTPPAGSSRSLRNGAPYGPPPRYTDSVDSGAIVREDDPVFRDLPSEPAEVQRWLQATFSGIGRFAADEVLARAGGDVAGVPAAFAALMEDTGAGRFAPHSIGSEDGLETIGVWAFAMQSVPAGRQFARESISTALDTFGATRAGRTEAAAERTSVSKAITRELVHRRRERAGAEATRNAGERADEYERWANTLLAHLPAVVRGAASATVPDPYGDDEGATVTIPLDAAISPQDNADRLFVRARKARDGAEVAADRIEGLTEEIEALEALEAALERDAEEDDIEAVRVRLARLVGPARAGAGAAARSGASQASKRPAEKPFGGHKIRTFQVDGHELLVGETAEANDYLTTRVAAPADLWMHVRAAPGAHGVLRTNGKPERIPDETVRRAAGVVAARSGTAVKHATLVAVDVVEKRHVRKPRGAKPGAVQYQRERVFDVAPVWL
jgi:predicted ribosome quality control (RQC) complex YloA/Tae2 family protein